MNDFMEKTHVSSNRKLKHPFRNKNQRFKIQFKVNESRYRRCAHSPKTKK